MVNTTTSTILYLNSVSTSHNDAEMTVNDYYFTRSAHGPKCIVSKSIALCRAVVGSLQYPVFHQLKLNQFLQLWMTWSQVERFIVVESSWWREGLSIARKVVASHTVHENDPFLETPETPVSKKGKRFVGPVCRGMLNIVLKNQVITIAKSD